MKILKFTLLSVLLVIPLFGSAQWMWEGEYNRFGLQAGANHFNISTGDLPISAGTSWTAGFTGRASFYNDFQFVYGINFFDFRNSVAGRIEADPDSNPAGIEFNTIGVQGSLMGSLKILEHYLSVEAGPVLQINSKFNPRQDKELFYIEDYDLQARDIREISTFNVNLAIGATGGFESFKAWVQYQHGVNNILNGLNDEGLREKDPGAADFRGYVSMFMIGIAMFL